MDKFNKVMESPWSKVFVLVLSLVDLCRCILAGSPVYGMLLCGFLIGASSILTLFGFIESKKD